MPSEKEAVALSSMAASAAMTVGKFTVGFMTGSLGLISEGAHSLMDLVSTIMTYMAVRVSDKPADEEHPYGHGKIESVAALGETVLLFVTSFWIINEAAHRLITGEVEIEVTWWAVAVIVVSILMDISRAVALKRVAKKTKSQALEADALHFSSDVFSSLVVLGGLGVAAMGWPRGDAIAAIGVSLFVCLAGWRLGRRTIDTLIDTAPAGVAERIREAAASVPAVIKVNRARVRQVGNVTFVDIDVAVGRGLQLSRIAAIRASIAERVEAIIDDADVTVSAHPLALDNETVNQRVSIIAADLGLSVHHVMSHRVNGMLSVSLDVEMDDAKTLGEAHDMATLLEKSIRDELGDDVEVETRIEPHQAENLAGIDADPKVVAGITELAKAEAKGLSLIKGIGKVRARATEHGLIIIFHCLIDAERGILESYEAVEELEIRIRNNWPDSWRVVGHAEPFHH